MGRIGAALLVWGVIIGALALAAIYAGAPPLPPARPVVNEAPIATPELLQDLSGDDGVDHPCRPHGRTVRCVAR